MLLHDLFEAVGPETAKNSLISSIQSLRGAMKQMTGTLLDRADELKIGRRMVGGQKARWVNDNYLSSRRFKNAGLQPTAEYYAKRSKSEQARKVFRELASLRFSAQKESGKAQIFDQISGILSALGSITKDEELLSLIQGLKEDRRQFELAFDGKGPTRSTEKQPTEQDLYRAAQKQEQGKQNQQAEEVFQEIVRSLPKPVQKQVRRATNRMGPAEKLAYLRSM